ncbi:MAG: DNA translocase FtsK 4TM domain-containing protein [Aeromonas sp.]
MAQKKLFTPLSGGQRLGEALLIIVTLLAAYLLLALLTFDPRDAGWSQTSWQGEIKNLAGSTGAWLADVAFFAFGRLAYLIGPVMVLVAWSLRFRAAHFFALDFFTLGLRLSGVMLLGLSGLTLASINFDPIAHFSPGGALGDGLAYLMLPQFGAVGANLLLLCALAAGVTLVSGCSWLTIVERVGEGACWLYASALSLPQRWQAWRGVRAPHAPDPLFDAVPSVLLGASQAPLLRWQDEAFDEVSIAPHAALASDEFNDSDLLAPAPQLATAPQTTAMLAPAAMPSSAAAMPAPAGVALPDPSLLNAPSAPSEQVQRDEIERMARLLEAKLADHNVRGKVVASQLGPVIARFTLELAPGSKANKLAFLAQDLARSLSAPSVRIVEIAAKAPAAPRELNDDALPAAVVPARLHIEVPNRIRQSVLLRAVVESDAFSHARAPLSFILGQDSAGTAVVANFTQQPHLLLAGDRGAGKTCALNALLSSLLFKTTPQQLRLMLLNFKPQGLGQFATLPHLYGDVVTEPNAGLDALVFCLQEMELRYQLLAQRGVRNINAYNQDPRVSPAEQLPSLLLVVDELASLMATDPKDVEAALVRLAQSGHGVGIHLVLATAQATDNVLTGVLLANFPARLVYQMKNRQAGRMLLDDVGADALLGQADGLYLAGVGAGVQRIHGAKVSAQEVQKVCLAWQQICAAAGAPAVANELNRNSSALDAMPEPQAPAREISAMAPEIPAATLAPTPAAELPTMPQAAPAPRPAPVADVHFSTFRAERD